MDTMSTMRAVQALNAFAVRGGRTLTANDLADAANINVFQARDLLHTWCTAGWLTREQTGRLGFTYTLTATGAAGLAGAAQQYG